MKTSSHAIFSADRKYRYRLTRWWYDGGPILCFCLLNASNANENRNDPTVHRCIGFGHYWGYSGIIIVNLNGLVSMDPTKLFTDPDPVGPENNDHLASAALSSEKIVAGWGNNGARMPHRVDEVLEILTKYKDVYCFSQTKIGQPRHPLYVKLAPESTLSIFRRKKPLSLIQKLKNKEV